MQRQRKVAKWVGLSSATISIVILGAFLLLSRCEQFGAVPTGLDHQKMTESPNYNTNQDIFVNEDPNVIEEMLAHSGFWANPRKNLTNNFLFNSNTPTPQSSASRSARTFAKRSVGYIRHCEVHLAGPCDCLSFNQWENYIIRSSFF